MRRKTNEEKKNGLKKETNDTKEGKKRKEGLNARGENVNTSR